jgi:DNA-binding NtrC family response regulator
MTRGNGARRTAHQPDARVSVDDVSDTIARVAAHVAGQVPSATLRSARLQFERDYVTLVLERYQGRVREAARALGIQRTNLYRKARQLGITMARTER